MTVEAGQLKTLSTIPIDVGVKDFNLPDFTKVEFRSKFEDITSNVKGIGNEVSARWTNWWSQEIEEWQPTDFETSALAQIAALGEVIEADEIIRRDLGRALTEDFNWSELNKLPHTKAAISTLGKIAGFGAKYLYAQDDSFRPGEKTLLKAGKTLLKDLRRIDQENDGVLRNIISGEVSAEQLVNTTLAEIHDSNGLSTELAESFGNAALVICKNSPCPGTTGRNEKRQYPIPPKIAIPVVIIMLALAGCAYSKSQKDILNNTQTPITSSQPLPTGESSGGREVQPTADLLGNQDGEDLSTIPEEPGVGLVGDIIQNDSVDIKQEIKKQFETPFSANEITGFKVKVGESEFDLASLPKDQEAGAEDERLFLNINGKWEELIRIPQEIGGQQYIVWTYDPKTGEIRELEAVLWYPALTEEQWRELTPEQKKQIIVAFAPPTPLENLIPGFSRDSDIGIQISIEDLPDQLRKVFASLIPVSGSIDTNNPNATQIPDVTESAQAAKLTQAEVIDPKLKERYIVNAGFTLEQWEVEIATKGSIEKEIVKPLVSEQGELFDIGIVPIQEINPDENPYYPTYADYPIYRITGVVSKDAYFDDEKGEIFAIIETYSSDGIPVEVNISFYIQETNDSGYSRKVLNGIYEEGYVSLEYLLDGYDFFLSKFKKGSMVQVFVLGKEYVRPTRQEEEARCNKIHSNQPNKDSLVQICMESWEIGNYRYERYHETTGEIVDSLLDGGEIEEGLVAFADGVVYPIP